MYATSFLVRSAVLNYVKGSERIMIQTICRFASAPANAPFARYEMAHKAFVSFADRLNAKKPLSEAQLAWLLGTKVSPITGKLSEGLLEQHADVLVKWYGHLFTAKAKTEIEVEIPAEDADAFLEDEEREDNLPF